MTIPAVADRLRTSVGVLAGTIGERNGNTIELRAVGSNTSPVLEVRRLTVSFGTSPIIEDLSLSVAAGESLAIIGPTGSGKTVFFRALIGALPYTGEVHWARGTRIGYVPQKLDIERDLPFAPGRTSFTPRKD